VISRPSFQPPTAFDGERDQPGLIAAAAPLGRCVPPTWTRPSGRAPADRQVTADLPWSPSQPVPTDRRPKRDTTADGNRKGPHGDPALRRVAWSSCRGGCCFC